MYTTSFEKSFGLVFIVNYVFSLVVRKIMRSTVAFIAKFVCGIESAGTDPYLNAAKSKYAALIEKL